MSWSFVWAMVTGMGALGVWGREMREMGGQLAKAGGDKWVCLHLLVVLLWTC